MPIVLFVGSSTRPTLRMRRAEGQSDSRDLTQSIKHPINRKDGTVEEFRFGKVLSFMAFHHRAQHLGATAEGHRPTKAGIGGPVAPGTLTCHILFGVRTPPRRTRLKLPHDGINA